MTALAFERRAAVHERPREVPGHGTCGQQVLAIEEGADRRGRRTDGNALEPSPVQQRAYRPGITGTQFRRVPTLARAIQSHDQPQQAREVERCLGALACSGAPGLQRARARADLPPPRLESAGILTGVDQAEDCGNPSFVRVHGGLPSPQSGSLASCPDTRGRARQGDDGQDPERRLPELDAGSECRFQHRSTGSARVKTPGGQNCQAGWRTSRAGRAGEFFSCVGRDARATPTIRVAGS